MTITTNYREIWYNVSNLERRGIFMNKKMVFFDIDGTLSDEYDFTIPESTYKALNLARENGHLMFINTGRTFSEIEERFKEMPMDGFVCGCGTHIYYQGEEIYASHLDKELRHRITDLSLECKLEAVLEGNNGIYFSEKCTDPYIVNIKNRYMKMGMPVYTYNEGDDVPFEKLTVWYFKDSDIDRFKETFKNDLFYIQRADNFIEITPIHHSKATGIKKLIDYLDIPWENTLSIGDSTNDLAMLQYTKESIAMGNSSKEILDKVTYITKDIHDDGIYHALKHFNII